MCLLRSEADYATICYTEGKMLYNVTVFTDRIGKYASVRRERRLSQYGCVESASHWGVSLLVGVGNIFVLSRMSNE